MSQPSASVELPLAFTMRWGELEWDLKLAEAPVGLYCARPELGPLLGLEGLAAPHRFEAGVFCGETLVRAERRGAGVEALYAPRDWGQLTVQARWMPHGPNAMDLEVEILAASVDELHLLEVIELSTLGAPPAPGSHRSVSPRDPASAALSYDGRETDLAALVTGPPGEPLAPWLVPQCGRKGWTYVEMAHPFDVSRRIHEGKLPFQMTRHALFGHSLEKGVVLRARLRGLWLLKQEAHATLHTHWHDFLNRPPPLTT